MKIAEAIKGLRADPKMKCPEGLSNRVFGAIRQVYGNEYFNGLAKYCRSHPNSSRKKISKKFKIHPSSISFILPIVKSGERLQMISGLEAKPPVRHQAAKKNKERSQTKMLRDKHKLLWKKANYNVLGVIDLDRYPSLKGSAMEDAQRLLVDSFNKTGMDKVEIVHLASGQAEFRRING